MTGIMEVKNRNVPFISPIDMLRREVWVNRPAGKESFIKELEKGFSCGLRRQKPARLPKKNTH